MMASSRNRFKYIYGPVHSWRLGMSLGIDPLTDKRKICNFDCPYCQLGRTAKFYTERENFVPVDAIVSEIRAFPAFQIDCYTFSGRGEPTLAKNLGAMIRAVRQACLPGRQATQGRIAVITNAGLIDREDVQEDLSLADWVLAKLDAYNEESFHAVDIPARGIELRRIVEGIKAFKQKFRGKLALQVMFVEENKRYASQIAALARTIGADEIQINTPLRPGGMVPLEQAELERLKAHFHGLPAVSVYEAERKIVEPLDEKATILRHGNFRKHAPYNPLRGSTGQAP